MGTFAEVYEAHVHAVFRFALSVCGRRDRAEDLTSDAFLALYTHFHEIDQSQLPGWLLTVVKNRARDLWRREVVELRYREQAVDEPATTELPLERWLLEAPELKAIHRTCLMLRYVYGMSRGEIAESTGLSETQVKGHLQYGLSLLRKVHVEAKRR